MPRYMADSHVTAFHCCIQLSANAFNSVTKPSRSLIANRASKSSGAMFAGARVDVINIFRRFPRCRLVLSHTYADVFPQFSQGFWAIPGGFDSRQLHWGLPAGCGDQQSGLAGGTGQTP